MSNHNIYNEDILDVLNRLDDNSVDLVFADPPYNIGKDYGNNIDKLDKEDYLSWGYDWISKVMSVLKDNGTFYLMCSTQYMPYFDIFIQEHYNIIQRIVWCYDSSSVQAKNYFGSLYEPILMCTKSKYASYTFNRNNVLVETKSSKRNLIDYRCNPPRPYNKFKVMGNVWNFNRVRYKMKEYYKHPSQKPMKLLERIILASSNPNDLVLDLFSGTGTTANVCELYDRDCISVELNPVYCNIIKERINNCQTTLI